MESLSSILKKASIPFSLCLIAFGLLVGGWKIQRDWTEFAACPNRDVLTWDANLRMLQTLDVRDDFVHGKVFRAIGNILESPTWPPLHGLIALVAYLFTSPSTVVEAGIGMLFFALTIALLAAMALYVGKSEELVISASLSFVASVIILSHTRELAAYATSAMLETQGMFFLALTMLALYRSFRNGKGITLLTFSSLGLFLTKYPYGHILVMAVVPVAIAAHFESIGPMIAFLRKRYRGVALILPGALMLLIAALAMARFLPEGILKVKGFKYVFYGLVVMLWIDLNWKFYRARAELNWIPAVWKTIYISVVTPILFLTFLNPDRFSSTVGTQLHEQDSARSFLLSFFDLTDSPVPLFAFAGLLVLSIVVAAIKRKSKLTRDPLFAMLLVLIMHVLILEFLTANKQLRHLYHLLPAILLTGMVFALREIRYPIRIIAGFVLLGSASILIASKGSVLKAEHYMFRYHCWTGVEANMYEPVRKLVSQIPEQKRYMLINRFHEPDAPLPGRLYATDFDLLIRMKPGTSARNDSRYQWKSWSEFDSVLLLQRECNDPVGENLLFTRAQTVGSLVNPGKQWTVPLLCIKEYPISKTGGTQ